MFLLQMLSDQGFFIRRLQFFIDLTDQLPGYSLTELQLLFQLPAALLILTIFNIITDITLIIQIPVTVYISDRLLHDLRSEFRFQKLLPELGLCPVHPFQQVQRFNLRFLQLRGLFLQILRALLPPAVLLCLVIHSAP